MYSTLQSLHSTWAYLVLLLLIVAVVTSLIGLVGKKEFTSQNFRTALFTLILTHIQLLIGFAIYFMSPFYKAAKAIGMGGAMKDSTLRLYVVEHPLVMIIAVALITVGFSKHKKKATAPEKFKTITVLYSIALVLILSRLPWSAWLA